jgi:Domain of unknown function (DUF5753)
MDAVFPERHGWFLEFYDESRSWAPAGFRDWPEHEDKATRLYVWMPGILHGLLQTEDYARVLIDIEPMMTPETATARLAQRMDRQRRVLLRDDAPSAWFIIDELSLYRKVGSAEVMAGQMRRLREVAAMRAVTMQVLPAVAHPATQSGCLIADNAAYAEHVAGGYVYTDDDTVTAMAMRFDTLRGECHRVSDTAALLERLEATWTTGASQVIRAATAETA